MAKMLNTSVNILDDDILKLMGMEVPSDAERETQCKNVHSDWGKKLKELSLPKKELPPEPRHQHQPEDPQHIGFYMLITLHSFQDLQTSLSFV